MDDMLPAGYDAAPLAPVIFIYDHKFRIKYQWNHPQFGEDVQQDFNLQNWNISTGINSSVGEASITIEDHDDVLTDGTDRAGSGIAAGDMIQILLGKRSVEPYFFGICDEPVVVRPGVNQKKIEVNAVGYGVRFGEKHISINHLQRLAPSGDVDDTDNTAKVSELVKRVLSDYSVILQPPPDLNLTIDVDDINLKLAKYNKTVNTTQATAIGELANLAQAVYGVDPNLRFFFHPDNLSSGFVITNDLDLNVDVGKLLIIRNEPYSYKNSTVRGAYTNLIGTDVTQSTLAYPDNQGNVKVDLWPLLDQAFLLPWDEGIDKLQISFTRTGNVTFPVEWWVIYRPASSYSGRYNPTYATHNAVAAGEIPITELNDLPLNIAQFIEFDVGQETPDEDHVVFFVCKSDSENINVNIKQDTDIIGHFPTNPANSSAGQAGQVRSRLPMVTNVLLKAQNLTLKHQKLIKENNQNFSDTPNSNTATQIFEGLMDSSGRVRRTYTGMVTSVPDNYPPLGKLYRIIDRFQKLDSYALLIGFDIGAGMDTYLTTTDMSLELEEWL